MNNIQEIIDNLNLIDRIIPDYVEGRNRELSDEEIESLPLVAILKAIELLEKEIPEKPLEQRCANKELIGKCPSCKLEWIVVFYQSYCSNCGQKLDWGNGK